ncbi:MAG: hypothetical protein K1X67_18610 [Fimbriimonadaceae bacterium]|nr:hypothetical protein [Fimbriimonadaceae bacterium]
MASGVSCGGDCRADGRLRLWGDDREPIGEGRQDFAPGQPMLYGHSITDSCIAIEQTEQVLALLAWSA